jgi:hypothetical protein
LLENGINILFRKHELPPPYTLSDDSTPPIMSGPESQWHVGQAAMPALLPAT